MKNLLSINKEHGLTMVISSLWIFSLVVIFCGPAVQAQDPSPAAPINASPESAQELERLAAELISVQSPYLSKDEFLMGPFKDLKAEEKEVVRQILSKMNLQYEYIKFMVPIFIKELTLEELKKIEEFYKTPAGRKLTQMNSKMNQEVFLFKDSLERKIKIMLIEELGRQNQNKRPNPPAGPINPSSQYNPPQVYNPPAQSNPPQQYYPPVDNNSSAGAPINQNAGPRP